ncbi:MAG: DUF3558 domain-containing protein [Rhodococcus sp. (in: high G+C Gram-positive bacteria)]
MPQPLGLTTATNSSLSKGQDRASRHPKLTSPDKAGTDSSWAASNALGGSTKWSGVSAMRWWAAGVVGVMLLVAGCGGVSDGAPTAAPSTTSAVSAPVSTETWDPCTIPDEAIEAAGLAVETKKSTLIGERPISPDWSTCYWRNPLPESWYHLGVFSSVFSLDYLREEGPFEQFTAVDGFDGLRFQRKIKYDEVSCGIAFGRDGGVVYFMLDGLARTEPRADPCAEVERLARSLRSSLPSSK